MIKSLVLFIVFFVADIAFWVLCEFFNAMDYFLPLIFIEVAICACVIIYDVAKLREEIKKINPEQKEPEQKENATEQKGDESKS